MLLDSVEVGIVACDAAGMLTVFNRFARELYGGDEPVDGPVELATPAAQIYEADGVTLVPPERLPLARALREGAVRDVELVIAPAGTARRRVLASSQSIKASDGNPLGAVATLHDITAPHHSERALRAANARLEETNARLTRSLAELESFAGVVSHDLKSPLATVTGYVQLLTHLDPTLRTSNEYDEFLGTITNATETMRALIDDLLAYATAPEAPLHLAQVDLGHLVHEVVSARINVLRYQDDPARPLPEIVVDPLPTVVADAAMLRQVFENLIDNAIKYTTPGQAAFVHVTGRIDPAGCARVEVADRGIGIPDGQHEAVFGYFHRAHADAGYPGTGLGLAICQRIMQRHGGAIGARPNRGGGTRFWLTLPARSTHPGE